jgi:hypothetical protein
MYVDYIAVAASLALKDGAVRADVIGAHQFRRLTAYNPTLHKASDAAY